MDEKIKAAAKILKIHPAVLEAVYKHAKEIDDQFAMNDVSPEDNIYATKIMMQDHDHNWYSSQDLPYDDKLWADKYTDKDFDDDDDDDDDDGGSEVIAPQPTILV